MKKLILLVLLLPTLAWGQSLSDINARIDLNYPSGQGIRFNTNHFEPTKFDSLNVVFKLLTTFMQDSLGNLSGLGDVNTHANPGDPRMVLAWDNTAGEWRDKEIDGGTNIAVTYPNDSTIQVNQTAVYTHNHDIGDLNDVGVLAPSSDSYIFSWDNINSDWEDKTISAGTGISITAGQTDIEITNTGQTSPLTAGDGITIAGDSISVGGTVAEDVTLDIAATKTFEISSTNTLTDQAGISLTQGFAPFPPVTPTARFGLKDVTTGWGADSWSLEFTNTQAKVYINGGANAGLTYNNVPTSSTANTLIHKGYVDDQISGLTTSTITEGTNLYYTAARFNTALATKTTDDLTEGSSNLYSKMPAGGTAGQVLTKDSGTDYDVSWTTNADTSYWKTDGSSTISNSGSIKEFFYYGAGSGDELAIGYGNSFGDGDGWNSTPATPNAGGFYFKPTSARVHLWNAGTGYETRLGLYQAELFGIVHDNNGNGALYGNGVGFEVNGSGTNHEFRFNSYHDYDNDSTTLSTKWQADFTDGGWQYVNDYSATWDTISTLATRARILPDIGFVESQLGGNDLSSAVQSPGAGQDDYVLYWDNGVGNYDLKAEGGLTDGEGTTANGTAVDLGGTASNPISLALQDIFTINSYNSSEIKFQANGAANVWGIISTSPVRNYLYVQDNLTDWSIVNNLGDEVDTYVTNSSVANGISIKFDDITVGKASTTGGMKYYADQSGNWGTINSSNLYIPHVGWTGSHLGFQDLHTTAQSPTVTEDGYVVYWDNGNSRYDLKAAAGGSGDVTKVGTPVNNQLGVWTGDGTIEGDADLTWDGATLTTVGDLSVSSEILTDSIKEKTASNGVWIEGVTVEDSDISFDGVGTINASSGLNFYGAGTLKLGLSASKLTALQVWSGINPIDINGDGALDIDVVSSAVITSSSSTVELEAGTSIYLEPADSVIIKNVIEDADAPKILALNSNDQVVFKYDTAGWETPNPTSINLDQDYVMSQTYTQTANVTFNTTGTIVKGKSYSFYYQANSTYTTSFNTTSKSWRIIGISDGDNVTSGLYSVIVTATSGTTFEAIFAAVTDSAP